MLDRKSSDSNRVIVTGAGGFLGRHLVGVLSNSGRQVVAISSQDRQALLPLWEQHSPQGGLDSIVTLPPSRVTELGLLPTDVVVNAGFSRVSSGRELSAGLNYQSELLGFFGANGISRIINVSSQSVYGPSRHQPATEMFEVAPPNLYAMAKYTQELITNVCFAGTEVIHLRLASLIGIGFDERLVNKMVARALTESRLTVTGNTKQIFDFMDVRDAARAVALFCSVPIHRTPEVVNIGGGQPLALIDIAECIVDVLNKEFSLEVQLHAELVADSELTSSALDVKRLSEEYGFTPEFRLKDTIRELARTN